MNFSELMLHPDIMRGIEEAGYVRCMPVQEQVFAHSFAGTDIYAQSQTGTGKTAAFLISIFQRMMTDASIRDKKTLILAPTRELAVQIEEEAAMLGKYLPVKMGAFYGGVAYGPQLDMLADNVQIIIGTPGRLIDLLQQGKMKLNDVGFLVVDEADRMFDMGFIDDIRKLMRYLPPARLRQTFLFSATLGMRIKDLAWEWMREPAEIAIEPEQVTVDLVTQELYHVGGHEKFSLLLGILNREKPESALIFCNQKYMVEELARRLRINGIECEFIMGDLPQSKRQSIIDDLKDGRLRILVATDVASRGLDVEALDLVINYDVPEEAESYVHRIGRTARAGKAGKAITFACEKFVFNLPAVEKYIGEKIPVAPFDTALLLEDKSARVNWRRAQDHGRSRSADTRRKSGTTRRPLAPEASLRERAHDNPYAMSPEERMQRYRQKYAGGAKHAAASHNAGVAKTGGATSQKPAQSGQAEQARRARQSGPAGQQKPAQSRQAAPQQAQKAQKTKKTQATLQQAQQATPQKASGQPAPQPGFFARLKKLFERKGRKQ